MKGMVGWLFVSCGVALLIAFQLVIVNPAFRQNEAGEYPETFGPVSYFRFPVYFLCLAVLVVGLIIIATFGGSGTE
jgi:hypothetical protein